MAVVNSIISFFNSKRLTQIDFFRKNPEEVQSKQLKTLLDLAKNTQWGNKYNFASINNYEKFINTVPVFKYEDIQSEIERIQKGEKNIMWSNEIKWFAKSSGTTSSQSKFIPISKETLEDCHYRGGKDVLAIYNDLYPDNELFSGKGLTLGGSQQLNNVSNNSFSGDLSAILIDNVPFWVNFIRTPEKNIALMDKWEEKLTKITEVTTKENVTSLSGVPSWFLVLIKHILNVKGTDNLLDIWPNLELFIHGGINFEPYRNQYKQIIPSDNMHYLETYNASEGFFAIQDDPKSKGMLLMLDYGIFYEFVPQSEWGKQFPKTISISDVELNTNYAILITTNSGLWRYQIGDTVKFISKYPHKIIISGRTKLFINAFGEELIVDNSDKAILKACKLTNSSIIEYIGAPMYMSAKDKGRHQWIIEFDKKPKDFNEFVRIMDDELQNLNSDYQAKRYKDITLDIPKVEIARENLFIDWLKSKNKLGGQNKIPRLTNNREIIEQLLKMN